MLNVSPQGRRHRYNLLKRTVTAGNIFTVFITVETAVSCGLGRRAGAGRMVQAGTNSIPIQEILLPKPILNAISRLNTFHFFSSGDAGQAVHCERAPWVAARLALSFACPRKKPH
jgi:hypothetical protein